MKVKLGQKSGITLVSLVVTIIILIILAGITINMTIGNNGILTIVKKAKENTELARIEEKTKLNELYEHISLEGGEPGDTSYDSIAKLNDFKKKIADYIEEAGGIKPEYTASIETFGDRIKGIVKEVTKDATATPEDIQEGKTAWVNGEILTGTAINDTTIKFTQIYNGRIGVQDGKPQWTVNVNISSLIENYQNLTVNNFLFEIQSITGNGVDGTNCGANISKSYNPTKGVIIVSVSHVGSAKHAFITGRLICVH